MNRETLNEPKGMTVLESYINTTDHNLDELMAVGNRLAKVVYKINELPPQSEKPTCEESNISCKNSINIIGQLWNQSGKLNNIITDLDSLVKILENTI